MFLINESEDSTLAVQDMIKQPISLFCMQPQSPSAKRLVRFDESSNLIVENRERYAEDCHETWYSESDYLNFRKSSVYIIERARAIESDNEHEAVSFSSILQVVHEAVDTVDFVLDDASPIMSGIEEMLAVLYTKFGHCSMIGLEPYIVQFLRKETRRRREAIQEAVAEIQEESRSGLWGDANMDREFYESCRNYSQASCLFAQLIARARLFA